MFDFYQVSSPLIIVSSLSTAIDLEMGSLINGLFQNNTQLEIVLNDRKISIF